VGQRDAVRLPIRHVVGGLGTHLGRHVRDLPGLGHVGQQPRGGPRVDPDRGADYLLDYYAFTGPFAEKIAAGNLTSARAVKDYVRGYEEAGCDELVLFPTVASLDDLERLQEAIA